MFEDAPAGVSAAQTAGCTVQVTVLSQSLKKLEDGLRLGADHYCATSDPATFDALAGTFDIIINTVSADLDYNAYLGLLDLHGAMSNVGVGPCR